MHIILDTGPWVALHCKNDKYHHWSKTQFSEYPGPFLTCEAVVAETCFLLARGGFDPSRALSLIERGVIDVAMALGDQIAAVKSLFSRYDNVPASLADACLVRLSELYEPSKIMTLDSDFQIYRRKGRKVISVISPM